MSGRMQRRHPCCVHSKLDNFPQQQPIRDDFDAVVIFWASASPRDAHLRGCPGLCSQPPAVATAKHGECRRKPYFDARPISYASGRCVLQAAQPSNSTPFSGLFTKSQCQASRSTLPVQRTVLRRGQEAGEDLTHFRSTLPVDPAQPQRQGGEDLIHLHNRAIDACHGAGGPGGWTCEREPQPRQAGRTSGRESCMLEVCHSLDSITAFCIDMASIGSVMTIVYLLSFKPWIVTYAAMFMFFSTSVCHDTVMT